MCVQKLNCRSPLGDDSQPVDWRSPRLLISTMTGASRNPNVTPSFQMLCPWPKPVTGPKNLQPWCCSCSSASCHMGTSNDVLFIDKLTLLQTHQCLPTPVSKIVVPQFLVVLMRVHQAIRAGQMSYLGRESQSNCLAAGKENLITYSFENLALLLLKNTWLWGEKIEVALALQMVENEPALSQTEILQTWQKPQLCLLLQFPQLLIHPHEQPLCSTPFSSLQECPTCHVSELFLSGHTMRYILCSVSVVPHILRLSSLTP